MASEEHVQSHLRTLVGTILHTLDQQKPFTIDSIDDNVI